MGVLGDAASRPAEVADPATEPPGPEQPALGGQEAPPRPSPPGPGGWTARQRWGMAVQAAVALLLIGVAISTSIRGLDDRDVRLHHLEHAALLCGGGLLGLLLSRLWPAGLGFTWERRPWLRPAALGVLLVEPLVLMAVMIPSTSPWIDAHPPVHALEHLGLIALGVLLGVVGYLFSPALGWLVVLVNVAMMAAFAGMALPTQEAQVAQTLAIGFASRW